MQRHEEYQYLDLLQELLDKGVQKGDRTGTGTLSVFGREMRFDLSIGFPAFTTKKTHLKSIIIELLWFLKGETNIKFLKQHGVSIWDEWADENGELGPVYGKQWRSWPTPDGRNIDQISVVINQIKKNPDSRRMIVSAWNVADIEKMKLPPCHLLFQFYVAEKKLSCKLTIRSSDTYLGLPYNVQSYSLLTHMIAQQCDLGVGEFIFSSGDTHLYLNHIEQAKLQLTREPRPFPQLLIKKKPKDIFSYTYEDFELLNYNPHPHIKAPVAV